MSSPPPPSNNHPNDSSWSTWSTWWQNFQDDQCLERLQHCQQLEGLLKQCQSSHSPTSSNTHRLDATESIVPGLRVMKYFQWRGIWQTMDSSSSTEEQYDPTQPTTAFQKRLLQTCSREQHAVWACRSVAIGCGKELSALQSCFQEEGAPAVLTVGTTAYEQEAQTHKKGRQNNNPEKKKKKKVRVPCQSLQQTLGKCVNQGAHALYERRAKKRQVEQQQQQDKQDAVLPTRKTKESS